MVKALYPGTFDPITNGHLDIIERARNCFGQVIVGVSHGEGKMPLFSHKERMELTKEVVSGMKDVMVESFHGLTATAAKDLGCSVLIRGLRVVSDYEYEMQLALMNKELSRELETVFFVSSHKYIFVSSSVIKEIAKHGGNVGDFVPKAVNRAIKEKFSKPRE
jgi:pantetheine-phosphate adenylyltransferase